MAPKVLYHEIDKISAPGKNFLESRGYEMKLGRGIDISLIKEDIADCDAVIVRFGTINEEVMLAAKNLKVIAKHGVGVERIDLDAARRLGIRVVNAPSGNTISVVEQTIMLILCCAKRLPEIQRLCKASDEKAISNFKSREVYGKTLGLIGCGNIGSKLAKAAVSALDMRVLAYDPFLKPEKAPDYITLTADRDKVIREADFLSLHLPINSQTRGSISNKEFAMMKNSAFLINAARGAIVDELALIKALDSGEIAGAGLDCTMDEPPLPDNPLQKMENVVLTPHVSAYTIEALERVCLHAAQGIDSVLSGKEPEWPVV